LGLNSCNDLPRLDQIADADASFLQATTDPESQIDLIPGLDLARQAERFAAQGVSDRSYAHRPDLDFRRLFLAASEERKRGRYEERNAFHRGIT